jgi:hypothetical protein
VSNVYEFDIPVELNGAPDCSAECSVQDGVLHGLIRNMKTGAELKAFAMILKPVVLKTEEGVKAVAEQILYVYGIGYEDGYDAGKNDGFSDGYTEGKLDC